MTSQSCQSGQLTADSCPSGAKDRFRGKAAQGTTDKTSTKTVRAVSPVWEGVLTSEMIGKQGN